MIKIAFFVEGQTERIFIEYFLDQYFTHPFFNVESYELIKDRARIITKSNYEEKDINYFFLIFDVKGDGNIASAVLERSEKLITSSEYKYVFGIRDLYPNRREDYDLIINNFLEIFSLKEYRSSLFLVIAIMEIEAWFLADFQFLERIDTNLTFDHINENLKIDLVNDDLEAYKHPSVTLDKILRLTGRKYDKSKSDIYLVCNNLDFADLILDDNKKNRIPSFLIFLNKLIEVI